MNEKITSDNLENDFFIFNNEEKDYTELISRLKDISESIALLEKKYSYKF